MDTEQLDTTTLAHAMIERLIHQGKPPTWRGILNADYAKHLYRTYGSGAWRYRVYRAVFHACPD